VSGNIGKPSTIISVKEFRKLAGKYADGLSDDMIIDLINDLDFMAELFIKYTVKTKGAGMK